MLNIKLIRNFAKNQTMTIEQITSEFKEILRPYTQNLEALDNLKSDSDFTNDLKINSANIVDIFLDTEEKFDIEINNDALETIENIGDAIQVIYDKVKENTSA